MYTVLSTLFCIAGWITALIVNVVWYKHCDKMNNEWYERCLSINETWADLCMELIGDETDHKYEPQTETSTNNSTISEKLQLKCDLCRREGDDICIDCERKKQSGKE